MCEERIGKSVPLGTVNITRQSLMMPNSDLGTDLSIRTPGSYSCQIHMSLVTRKPAFCILKTKITAKLISTFVFATRIVQSLYFLNPVCVGPGRTHRRPVFSQRGSYIITLEICEWRILVRDLISSCVGTLTVSMQILGLVILRSLGVSMPTQLEQL